MPKRIELIPIKGSPKIRKSTILKDSENLRNSAFNPSAFEKVQNKNSRGNKNVKKNLII